MSKSKYNICISVQTTVYYQVSWCSGYHISLTPKRSPVRSRARSTFFLSIKHVGWDVVQKELLGFAECQDRTDDLRIMRPTL